MKSVISLILTAFILAACANESGTEATLSFTTVPTADTGGEVATSTPSASITPILTTEVTATAQPAGPVIAPVIEFGGADAFGGFDDEPPSRVFPARTPNVVASFQFFGIPQGTIMRREWYRNGSLWIDVEESWMIWIYSNEEVDSGIGTILLADDEGLPSGTYELRIYLDGVPQFGPTDDPALRSFEILADGAEIQEPLTSLIKLPSPDGSRTAIVENHETIRIEAANSQILELEPFRVNALVWLPDSRHIFYIDRLPELAGRAPAYAQMPTQAYVLNTETGARVRVADIDNRLAWAAASPGGNAIAVESGSGFSDACHSDTGLAVLMLDNGMQVVERVGLMGFNGLPQAHEDEAPGPYQELRWINATQFTVGLSWSCSPVPENGVYLFDISTQSAQQIQSQTPGVVPPIFFRGIEFALVPDEAAMPDEAAVPPVFIGETPEVFALWGYDHMSEGLIVRREWYLNGDLYLVREEPWDFARYGTSGVVRDISIYDSPSDQDETLPPGLYELRLYIDGVPQFRLFDDDENRSFIIQIPDR